ncbi:MAG: hypothetical protein IJU20_03670 [Clostridia bacterium]|nr:hypothetical protein [Clostridia bacterium]
MRASVRAALRLLQKPKGQSPALAILCGALVLLFSPLLFFFGSLRVLPDVILPVQEENLSGMPMAFLFEEGSEEKLASCMEEMEPELPDGEERTLVALAFLCSAGEEGREAGPFAFCRVYVTEGPAGLTRVGYLETDGESGLFLEPLAALWERRGREETEAEEARHGPAETEPVSGHPEQRN